MDWGILGLVVVFVVRGLIRGATRQVFGLIGFVCGLWLALVVSRWVGALWVGARPAVFFWVLRWVVAAVAGLAVATLFHWWGSQVGRAVQAGPAGWLDRVLGMALGASIGWVWAVALLTLALLAPPPVGAGAAVRRAVTAHALVAAGARTWDAVESRVPVFHGVGRLLHDAERRARADPRGS